MTDWAERGINGDTARSTPAAEPIAAAELRSSPVRLVGEGATAGAVTEPRAPWSPPTSLAGREARAGRDRGADPWAPESVEADESALAEESAGSDGEAEADPRPPVATPIPNATARPPTRPTKADARISDSSRTSASARLRLAVHDGGEKSSNTGNSRRAARPRSQVLPPNTPTRTNHDTPTAPVGTYSITHCGSSADCLVNQTRVCRDSEQ
jgi:hypothetical protein